MTTFEMDGLFTAEDIANKDSVVFQCRNCRRWTVYKNYKSMMSNEFVPCVGCGRIDYDLKSVKSLRTYEPLADSKRRPK